MSQDDRTTGHLPECVVEYIDGLVRDLRLRRHVCVEVRQELQDHFDDALSRVEGETERTRNAEKLIVQFGEEAVLTTLIRRGKRRCRKEYAVNLSGIAGLGLFVLAIGLAIVSDPAFFVSFPAAIICVGGAAAIGIMSYGMQDFFRGVWALRVLFVRVPPQAVSSREATVLRGLIGPVYVSAIIGTVIGLIQNLAYITHLQQIAPYTAALLLRPFYAVLIAEGMIRPAARVIAEFGDETALIALARKDEMCCREKETVNLSGIVGLGVFVLALGLTIVYNAALFVNIPSAGICVWITAALGIMSYGMQDFFRGIRALRVLLVRVAPDALSSREATVLRGLIAPIYVSGLIGNMIGIIQMLWTFRDPSTLGPGFAISLLCPFYAVLMAEAVVRPAARLIEHDKLADNDKLQNLAVREVVTESEIAE